MARFALVLALALTFCARTVSAQDTGHVDTVHVLPPDSVGPFVRRQSELFRRSIPKWDVSANRLAWWEVLPGTSHVRADIARFDTTVALSRVSSAEEVRRQHLMRQLGIRTAEVATRRRRVLVACQTLRRR